MELWKVFFCVSADQILPKQKVFPFQIFMFAGTVASFLLDSYIIHHFSGAPCGAFQQPVYNKCKVRWLRVLARPLQAVHNVFLSETLSCALS